MSIFLNSLLIISSFNMNPDYLDSSSAYGNEYNFSNGYSLFIQSVNKLNSDSKNDKENMLSKLCFEICDNKDKNSFRNKFIDVFNKINKIYRNAEHKKIKKTDKLVAITFDDGPSEYTPKLLDALKKYNVKATFFVLGVRSANKLNILKRINNEGHELASHTYNHYALTNLSNSSIFREINNTDRYIIKAKKKPAFLVRPPYGDFNGRVRNIFYNKGKACIMWSFDTRDWANKNVSYVKNLLVDKTKDGDIVLLHDIHKTTVDGFIAALPILVKKGFKFVTVSELMKLREIKLEKGKVYSGGRK